LIKMEFVSAWPAIATTACPLAFFHAEQSRIVTTEVVAEQKA